MVDGTDTGSHSGGRTRLRAVVRFTLLTSLVVLLTVPSVLLGDPARAGASEADENQGPGRSPGSDTALVFQAVRCAEWADVPGNFTPDVPIDDTEGRYRSWGPVDPAVVEPVELGEAAGDCQQLDGVRFRVSAVAWGVDLLDEAPVPTDTAGDPETHRFEGQHNSPAADTDEPQDVVSGPGPDEEPREGPSPAVPEAEADPKGDWGPATSTVAGATGTDGEGRLVATTAELSAAQQRALRDGSGLWVAASGFQGTFANLRCHTDRFNADNLEVIRASETEASLACVLYVVQAGAGAPVVATPPAGPPSQPAMDPAPVLPLAPGAITIVTPAAPASVEVAVAAPDPDPLTAEPDAAAPTDGAAALAPGAGTGGGLGLDNPTAPGTMTPGSRAVQEGLADLTGYHDPGRLLERDPPLSAPHAIAGSAPPAGAAPALPAVALGPSLAGSRITALVVMDMTAPLRAPVTQNLTAALAAGLSALFLTGLGITIKVAGRPF